MNTISGHFESICLIYIIHLKDCCFMYSQQFPFCITTLQWGRRLEGWPNTAASRCDFVREGRSVPPAYPYRTGCPDRSFMLSCVRMDFPAAVIKEMCTTIRHELRHARKAWFGTLVDPCLLSAPLPSTPPPPAVRPNWKCRPVMWG